MCVKLAAVALEPVLPPRKRCSADWQPCTPTHPDERVALSCSHAAQLAPHGGGQALQARRVAGACLGGRAPLEGEGLRQEGARAATRRKRGERGGGAQRCVLSALCKYVGWGMALLKDRTVKAQHLGE
jgi:hypothetical protein